MATDVSGPVEGMCGLTRKPTDSPTSLSTEKSRTSYGIAATTRPAYVQVTYYRGTTGATPSTPQSEASWFIDLRPLCRPTTMRYGPFEMRGCLTRR